jgi:bacteriocin biosynthesis cyclodehydratase domain-containing protein
MLDELRVPSAGHLLVARAVERGADREDAVQLLHELHAASVLVDAATVTRPVRQRASSTAVVVGHGPLAVGIVGGLVLAGVGTVHTDTAGHVHSGDLGTGYLDADRGTDRLLATRAAVARLVPGAGTGPPPLRLVPDLVVLADEIPEPVTLAALHADGVAHLPVRLRDGAGVVGPLVLPGRSTCLRCLDLQRAAQDHAWPLAAAQLVGTAGHADPSCVAATVGLATAQALAALDCGGPAPAVLDATLELDVTAGTLNRREWMADPECPCRAASMSAASMSAASMSAASEPERATSATRRDWDTIGW